MGSKRDSNYVSVGSWMLMMLVTAIPLIGLIMVFVWAFTGENESRKNYFRAMLVWMLIATLLTVVLIATGVLAASWPTIHKQIPAVRIHRS